MLKLKLNKLEIELNVNSASKRSKGYEVSFSFQRYFIFASGVKNRTVICINCRNMSGV